jgi:NitT/TauT family transport system substrate-binding protein
VPNIGYLPLYVGQKMGFFENEGLNVTVNYSHGDSVSIQAIDTGQAQVMSGTPEALIRSYEKGLHGVLFYQIYRNLIYSVAVAEGSKIKSPADLAGKTIGVSSMGSTGLIIAKVTAKDAGVDPASLKFLPVGTGQRALSALKDGQVDALSLWDAAYAQIETAAPDMKLTHWLPASLRNVGDGGYFTTWDLIQKMPNTLAHFTRAIAKSMAAIHADPAKALEIYWDVNPSGKPKGSDAEAHKIGLAQLEILGRSFDLTGVPTEVDMPSLNAYIKTFVDQGIVTKAPPIEEFVTNAFVPIAKAAANEQAK